MEILDRLYGSIHIDANELKLLQTPSIARLRHLSLNAVPDFATPASTCATKFEHSLGVAHLSRLLSEDFSEISFELFCACLAHDCGTPPFSHTAEHLLFEMTGKNHEEFAADQLANSRFADLVTQLGGDFALVLDLIEGKGEFGKVLNGNIDLDNLDNSLRYGISMGILESGRPLSYSPEALARSFRFHEGQLCFCESSDALFSIEMEYENWKSCRRKIYDFAQSESNMVVGQMLFRALEFAYREGKIKKEFFALDDSEAFNYLLKKTNTRTSRFMEMLYNWEFYRLVCARSVPEIEFSRRCCSARKFRGELSDRLARDLGLDLESVIVYIGSDKGYKEVGLKVMRDRKDRISTLPDMESREKNLFIQVYLDPALDITGSVKEKVVDFVEELLTEKALITNSYR